MTDAAGVVGRIARRRARHSGGGQASIDARQAAGTCQSSVLPVHPNADAQHQVPPTALGVTGRRRHIDSRLNR